MSPKTGESECRAEKKFFLNEKKYQRKAQHQCGGKAIWGKQVSHERGCGSIGGTKNK